MTTYKQTTDLIKSLVQHEYLNLDAAITITGNVFAYPLHIWSLCVSPYGDLYIMNDESLWHQVQPDDNEIIEAVHRRVAVIAAKYLGVLVSPAAIPNVLICQNA